MAIDKQHWSSEQSVKHDEVRDFAAHGIEWVLTHRRQAGLTIAGIVAVSSLLMLFVYSRESKKNAAWEKLAIAEAYSYYGRQDEALAALKEASAQTASPSASALASLLTGEIKRDAKDFDAAVATIDAASATAPESLKPFLAANKVATLETAEKFGDCASNAQNFIDTYSDHFLAPQISETLGRCQLAQGQPEAARATWQKIALQYTDTAWAMRANARLVAPKK